jgi:hypothetical protein
MFAIVACCKLPPGVINRSRVVNEPVAALDSRVDDAEFPGSAAQGLRVEPLFDGLQQVACCRPTAGGGTKDAENRSEDRDPCPPQTWFTG